MNLYLELIASILLLILSGTGIIILMDRITGTSQIISDMREQRRAKIKAFLARQEEIMQNHRFDEVMEQ
jgi:hypothetical protein